MIQNSDFILKTINGSSYLLPTGQDGLWHTLSIAVLTFSLYGENTSFSPRFCPLQQILCLLFLTGPCLF